MKKNVSELAGPALDWAVAKCEGDESYAAVFYDENWLPIVREPEGDFNFQTEWQPSTDWAQGGPIIEREKIETRPRHRETEAVAPWGAFINLGNSDFFFADGPTPLIAAMRCYVARKLGPKIEVPDHLA